MNEPPKKAIYKHYKGGLYTVLGTATHSETGEDMVIYKSEETGKTWVRPLSIWLSLTEDGRVRFAPVRCLKSEQQRNG